MYHDIPCSNPRKTKVKDGIFDCVNTCEDSQSLSRLAACHNRAEPQIYVVPSERNSTHCLSDQRGLDVGPRENERSECSVIVVGYVVVTRTSQGSTSFGGIFPILKCVGAALRP